MTAATKTRGPWAMPDATVILPADASRAEWLEMRRRGIGGSDASTVAGVNRWSTRYELWLDKTGRLDEQPASARMEAGTRLEPVLRSWFTDSTGITVRRQGLVRSRAHPVQQVSLDGLTEDGGILEAKTTGWYMAEEWEDDQVSDHAEIQCQHALGVTGRSHAWVVVLIDGWDFQVRRIERNQELIDLLAAMELEFWEQYIARDAEPPITAAADLDVVKRRYPAVEQSDVQVSPDLFRDLAAALADAKATEKAATAEKKTIEAQLRNMIGDAGDAYIGDQKVATLHTTERGGYTVEPTSFRQLRIITKKAGK